MAEVSQWINNQNIQFQQLPGRKQHYVKALTEDRKKVLMVGDGLNDSGALKASHVGLAVTESSSQFSPASDAITLGNGLLQLPKVLGLAKHSIKVIKVAFIVSFLYNIIGISMAVQGLLSPVFAAILMPISSVSVVLIGLTGISIGQKKMNYKKQKS
jgi:Cu+-exporting ATPase